MKIREKILINYLQKIRKKSKNDIFSVINPTLIANPYVSLFPFRLFTKDIVITPKIKLFIKWTKLCYKINFNNLKKYFRAYKDYKTYYSKKISISKDEIIFDLYLNTKDIENNQYYKDSYLDSIYNVLDKNSIKYCFLLRLIVADYTNYKNFFEIASKDRNKYLLEFDLLNYFDFLKIALFILIYPFKTLRHLQKEKNDIDIIFNVSLIRDISRLQFDSITRYFFAKKLAKIRNINKIYSWCENQSIDRTFNFGIRSTNSKIKLIGLQFFLNPKNYFNSILYDNEFKLLTTPHTIYVNGKYFLKERKYINYKLGISPRYNYISTFNHLKDENIVFLGTYFKEENNMLINLANNLKKYNPIFKIHPLTGKKELEKIKISTSNKPLNELFQSTKLIISSSSGSIIEALACGISVLILTTPSKINLEYTCNVGKGILWEYLDNIEDFEFYLNKLLKIRKNNLIEIQKNSTWYKDNFFEETTNTKIIEIFSNKE